MTHRSTFYIFTSAQLIVVLQNVSTALKVSAWASELFSTAKPNMLKHLDLIGQLLLHVWLNLSEHTTKSEVIKYTEVSFDPLFTLNKSTKVLYTSLKILLSIYWIITFAAPTAANSTELLKSQKVNFVCVWAYFSCQQSVFSHLSSHLTLDSVTDIPLHVIAI